MKLARLLAFSALLACDPVHGNAVAALPGEDPNVPHGPLHRPGQPCLLCHGDFNVAGTVFANASDTQPAVGVAVNLTDSQSHTFTTTTNEAGNFFVRKTDWTPIYPMKVALQYGGITATMTANVGRDGSCAACHFDPAGPSSPGHVYTPADGGTP